MTEAVSPKPFVLPAVPSLKRPPKVMMALAAAPDRLELNVPTTATVPASPSIKPSEGPWAVMPLPELPAVGEPLKWQNPHTLGSILTELVTASKPGSDSSDWSDPQDLRLVLPVVRRKAGPLEAAYEIMPGRDDQRVTLKASGKPADSRLNGDGLQAGVRMGTRQPFSILPSKGAPYGDMLFQPMQVEWAEFRVGAEGLVFTGRLHKGQFEVTQFDLENGFFQAKLEGLGEWAKDNLAIAIPLGIAGIGVAFISLHQAAKLTGREIALPLGTTVYKRDGVSLRPSVRTILTPEGDMRFGGAELSAGYQIGERAAIQLLPRYNQDPNKGKTGLSVGARATFTIPHGLAGIEVRVDDEGHVSAYAGVGGVF